MAGKKLFRVGYRTSANTKIHSPDGSLKRGVSPIGAANEAPSVSFKIPKKLIMKMANETRVEKKQTSSHTKSRLPNMSSSIKDEPQKPKPTSLEPRPRANLMSANHAQ